MKHATPILALSGFLLCGAALADDHGKASSMGRGGMGMMDMPMMKEHMSRMRDHMKSMKAAKSDADRTRLMQEHMEMMDDHMDMMMRMMDKKGCDGDATSAPAPAASEADHEAHHPKE